MLTYGRFKELLKIAEEELDVKDTDEVHVTCLGTFAIITKRKFGFISVDFDFDSNEMAEVCLDGKAFPFEK